MNKKLFWFVRLSADVRPLAKLAALHEGKTMWLWISDLIREHAQKYVKPK